MSTITNNNNNNNNNNNDNNNSKTIKADFQLQASKKADSSLKNSTEVQCNGETYTIQIFDSNKNQVSMGDNDWKAVADKVQDLFAQLSSQKLVTTKPDSLKVKINQDGSVKHYKYKEPGTDAKFKKITTPLQKPIIFSDIPYFKKEKVIKAEEKKKVIDVEEVPLTRKKRSLSLKDKQLLLIKNNALFVNVDKYHNDFLKVTGIKDEKLDKEANLINKLYSVIEKDELDRYLK